MAKDKIKITVAGIGYVGLSMAVLLAQKNDVTAFDVSAEKVDLLNKKICPIEDTVAQEFLDTKKLSLKATLDEKEAFENADYIVLAVPTNFDEDKGCFDTSIMENVISTVKKYNDKAVIIIKSTIGIGYTRKAKEKTGYKNIVFSPEFLREGKSLYDNLYPSRIIIGTDKSDKELHNKSLTFAEMLRDATAEKKAKTMVMGLEEAEAVKLFSNSYLAMRVAYFNELDTFAETHNLNTEDIVNGVCAEPRIGDGYNNPSFGYGGYCFPKDTKQLRNDFGAIEYSLIGAIVDSNIQRKDFVANAAFMRAKSISSKDAPTIGVHRLVMKSGSDNFRESAIQFVIKNLVKMGAKIIIYEPTISGKFEGFPVIEKLADFKKMSDLIITNRMSDDLADSAQKVYTRDVFTRD